MRIDIDLLVTFYNNLFCPSEAVVHLQISWQKNIALQKES